MECRHTRTALYHPCSRPACMLLVITRPVCWLPYYLAVNRLGLSGRILLHLCCTSEPSWIVVGLTLPSPVLNRVAIDSCHMASSHYLQQNPLRDNCIYPPVTYSTIFERHLIFVVPCIMLYSGEISPTRCNNCVFYSQWLYSTCFG